MNAHSFASAIILWKAASIPQAGLPPLAKSRDDYMCPKHISRRVVDGFFRFLRDGGPASQQLEFKLPLVR